eukprot:6732955-Lingulodinium_polyedra.AAC.1
MADLVDFIAMSPNSHMYYLNGFSRLTPDKKEFLVKVAVTARLSEGVLLELAQDPRVAQTYAELWGGISKD